MAAEIFMLIVGVLMLLGLLSMVRLTRMQNDIRRGRNVEKARTRMKQPVDGILQVTGVSAPSADNVWKECRLTGVLSAAGVEPRPVQRSEFISTGMWPKPGDQLVVVVDRADPADFLVDWGKRKAPDAGAFEEAERLAAAMRSAGPRD